VLVGQVPIPYVSSHGLLEEKRDEKNTMTNKEKDGKTLNYFLLFGRGNHSTFFFFFFFQRNDTTNMAYHGNYLLRRIRQFRGIFLFFFVRLSSLVLCYILAAVVLVGASSTELFLL
jgi:hypothetical protein